MKKHYLCFGIVILLFIGCSVPKENVAVTAFGYTKYPKPIKAKKNKNKVSATEVVIDAVGENIDKAIDKKNGLPEKKPPGIL